MKRSSLLGISGGSAALLALGAITFGVVGCTQALTPTQTTEAQIAVQIAAAFLPGGSAALATGQLICQGAAGVVGVFDQATGQPYLVTGKAATTVADVCSAIGSSYTPVAPAEAVAASPTATVTGVKVALPAGA